MKTFKRTAAAVSVAVLAVFAVGCSSSDDSADGDSTETTASGGGGGGGDGQELFEGSCASCHGDDATGLPNLGKDLTTSEVVAGMTDEEVAALITEGRSTSDPENTTGVDMPPKGGDPSLSSEDVDAIVVYLRTLEK